MDQAMKLGMKIVLAALWLGASLGSAQAAQYWGLYLHAPLAGTTPVTQVSDDLVRGANDLGFGVLAVESMTTGDPRWEARVLVLDDPAYRRAVLKKGGGNGGFAATLRLAVCRDGAKRFVSILNPVALASVFVGVEGHDRVSPIVGDAQVALDRILKLVQQTTGAVLGGQGEEGAGLGHFEPVRLEQVWPQYRSFFGTTMGEALKEQGTYRVSLKNAVERVSQMMGEHAAEMPIYQLIDESAGVAVIGVSWAWIEKTAFEIIKKIDHAPAFPLEFVLVAQGDRVKVMTLAEMWRMDVYFSDASKWAFMTHIAIPGELDDQKAALVAATP